MMMSVDGLSQQMSRLRLVALGALPGSGRDTVALPVGLLPFLLLHRGTPQPTTCPVRSRATPNAALFQVWPTACGGPTCARRCCSAPQEGRRGSCTACRRSSCRARTTARCYQRRRGVVPCSVAGAPPAVAATASPRLASRRIEPRRPPLPPALPSPGNSAPGSSTFEDGDAVGKRPASGRPSSRWEAGELRRCRPKMLRGSSCRPSPRFGRKARAGSSAVGRCGAGCHVQAG
jgi:hypothetical protein